MSEPQPHAKYPHVFGVLRIDTYDDIDPELNEERLTLTAVFSTEQAAERDAARLNELAQKRGAHSKYITLITRLKS